MAKVHADAIMANGAHVAAIYDPFAQAADALAIKTGGAVCSSAQAAINHVDVDAVMIVTSSDTHVPLIIEAVRAGKAVFCEKPLSDTLDSARECVETIGEDAAKRVFLGFNRRFDVGHGSLREKVKAGAIGRLEQIIITSRDPSPPPLDYVPKSGGLFRDMMIHDFDMARSILGREPVTVSAVGTSIIDPEIGKLGDVDSASVTMTTPDGVIVVINNSRRCAFGYDQRVEAFGSDGMVVSDNVRRSGLVSYSRDHHGVPDDVFEFFMDRYGQSYADEIRVFVECARSGSDMPVNAIDGLQAMILAEAATRSCQSGRPVTINQQSRELKVA